MAKKKAGAAELLEAVRQQVVDDAARKKRHKPGEAGAVPAATTTTTTPTTTATNGAVPSAASAAAAAQAKWRKQHELLVRDLHAATHPNIVGPFTSTEDACERLLAYHVFYEAEEDDQGEQPSPSTSGTASAAEDARASWHIWQTTYEAKVDEFIKAIAAHKAKLQARRDKMQGPLTAEEQLMISKLQYAESQSRLASRKPNAPSNSPNIPSTLCNNSSTNISSTSALQANRPAVSFMTSAARGNNTNSSNVNSGISASRPNIFAMQGNGSSASHVVSNSSGGSGSLGGIAPIANPNVPSLFAPSKQQ